MSTQKSLNYFKINHYTTTSLNFLGKFHASGVNYAGNYPTFTVVCTDFPRFSPILVIFCQNVPRSGKKAHLTIAKRPWYNIMGEAAQRRRERAKKEPGQPFGHPGSVRVSPYLSGSPHEPPSGHAWSPWPESWRRSRQGRGFRRSRSRWTPWSRPGHRPSRYARP